MTRQIEILGLLALLCITNFGCKQEHEQMKNQAIAKEELFKSFVDYFISSLPDSNYIVTFGVGHSNNVNITYYKNQGNIADKKNHYGGNNLRLHTPELDKAINDLGWTYVTINKLTQGLKAIQCEYIRNTDWFGKPVNVFNTPDGFVNSDYNIYPIEMLDTVRIIHGEPVGQTEFLKRVYIITSSAL